MNSDLIYESTEQEIYYENNMNSIINSLPYYFVNNR